ncbi:unnamed protein product [Rotaria sp. Silwood1]|nr:unnamed protein product [Rotaria sp. Silwood1]CAF1636877.1 unnamed protein product [Rotaria sp. Silwood1]
MRLCDHDERFRIPKPPSAPPPPSLPQLSQITLSSISSTNENIYAQSFSSIFILTPPLPNEPNKIFDDENYNDRYNKLVEQLKEQYRQKEILLSNSLITTKAESIIPSEETILKTCLGKFESLSSSSPSSEHSSIVDDNHSLNINNNNNDLQKENNTNLTSIEDDSTRSRDEFVKLLTKQAYISKSSSPVKIQNNRKRSYDYHHHQRRRSHNDNHEKKNSSSSYRSNYHQLILVSNCAHENQDNKQNIDNQIDQQEEVEDEEPTVKRIKVDHSISPSSSSDRTNQDENLNKKDLSLKSIVTIPTITNIRHKRFNYTHESVGNHPRCANPNSLPPMPLMNFNYPKSPIHRHKQKSTNHSESTTINYSNCFDSKPSHAIERLQIILQNKTNDKPFEQSHMSYSVNETVKYSSSSMNNDNSQRSSSFSGKSKPDTIVHNNNQIFTYHKTEKLLNMVQ